MTVTGVANAGLTVYHVITEAQLGTASVDVPTSPQATHLIDVTNGSGSILVTSGRGRGGS